MMIEEVVDEIERGFLIYVYGVGSFFMRKKFFYGVGKMSW